MEVGEALEDRGALSEVVGPVAGEFVEERERTVQACPRVHVGVDPRRPVGRLDQVRHCAGRLACCRPVVGESLDQVRPVVRLDGPCQHGMEHCSAWR
jgi:hypothetical protein